MENTKSPDLFTALFNPELDALSLAERLKVFDDYNNYLIEKGTVHHNRYSSNGCKTERRVFDTSLGKIVDMINFGSNDYLNMSQNPIVINTASDAIKKYGLGAGASSNASGNTSEKLCLETCIADTFGYEKALVYPSGFMANVGVLSAMLRSNDIAIVDINAHASIIDGCSDRNKMMFRHNDMRSLETVLARCRHQYVNKIVIVDGVYSMDGDIANLPEISALCKKYGALLMVDEAHAFGVIGKNGLGILDHFNMPSNTIDILTGSLSKAVGCSGGFVTGKKELINYLQLASRAYMFTTAPFIASNAAALESIRIIIQDAQRRKKLWNNINYFKSKIKMSGLNMGNSETAIFPIILGDHDKVLEVTKVMGHNGVLVNGIPYPAVPRKQTRIRMTVTSEMTIAQLDKGYNELNNAINL